MGTSEKQKQVKVTTKLTPTTKYFSTRIPLEDYEGLKRIAEVETEKAFQPVRIVSIMRKFIRQGIERWEKENA